MDRNENNINNDSNFAQQAPQQQVPQPQTVPPATMMRKPLTTFGLIKMVVAGLFGIVCLFGVWSAISDNFLPHNKSGAVISPSVAPSVAVAWKTFTNNKFHYSVKYPDSLEMSQDSPYSTVYQVKNRQRIGFPSLYISVIPDGFSNKDAIYNFMSADVINNFFTLPDNGSQLIEPGQDPQYWTYKRLASVPVADVSGVMIENDNVWDSQDGVINRRVLVKRNGFTYIIGSYYHTQQELNDFHDFVSSFTFLQ